MVLFKCDADVYVHRCLEPFSGLLALLLRLTGKKIVYMIACDHELDARYTKYHGFIRAIMARSIFVFSNHILAQTVAQYDYLVSKKIKNGTILRSAMELENVPKNEDGYILWVARAVDHKRPQIFLDYARTHPNRKCIMILARKGSDNKCFDDIRRESQHCKNIQLIEYVPFHSIARYYEKARVFVSTSSLEGFPFSFIQAIATKTPIVSLAIDPDGMLEKYKCGFYCNDDRQTMFDSIERLVNSEELRSEIGNNAFKYARDNHDIKVIAKQFHKIIADL
jgi:glycosyltransferase involved in cell wall biosynthesis